MMSTYIEIPVEDIVSEYDQFKLYLGTRNVAIIIDESAKLKNPNAKVTRVFFELSTLFKTRNVSL